MRVPYSQLPSPNAYDRFCRQWGEGLSLLGALIWGCFPIYLLFNLVKFVLLSLLPFLFTALTTKIAALF